ncbi:lasso RiPP family leader peptide-containing protein [Streptomyces iconiensis]|uniref:Lasso RiPP family leader peptide-containing protein n=1 Tax=Streptomyces iconiensis TaxID=1384038 RepID=A0ABT7A0K7_9ACTN|nr:lasso RiPP family leader peptide-containing protein [Streptomyces iconiensis]MDJ1134867.1 lasso RiPP family leader peptide-containing protein [Streptomyces iconiensis]
MAVAEFEYEAPEFVVVGDFSEITLGRPNWGFDSVWTCARVGCHD